MYELLPSFVQAYGRLSRHLVQKKIDEVKGGFDYISWSEWAEWVCFRIFSLIICITWTTTWAIKQLDDYTNKETTQMQK